MQQQWRPPFIGAGVQLYSTKQMYAQIIYVLFISLTISFYTTQYVTRASYAQRIGVLECILVILAALCLLTLSVIALTWYTRHLHEAKRPFLWTLLLLSLLLAQYVQYEQAEIQKSLYPGAAAIYDDITPRDNIPFYQSYEDVILDRPVFYQYDQCQAMYLVEIRKCSYGVVDDPDYVLALVAGSHSAHWFPAIEPLAEELNFRIDIYNHDGCRFTDEDPDGHLTEQCIEWNAKLIKVLKQNPPDVVFTTASLNKRNYVPRGYIRQWERLEGYSTVFAIRDTPRMNEPTPACLQQHNDEIAPCSMPRDEALSREVPWENADNIPSNVVFGDLSDYFCDDTTCYPVIGNILIYRDQHHLTSSYVKTLAPVLRPYLVEAFEKSETIKR